MPNKGKLGWYKEGDSYVLYDDYGNVVRTQSHNPKARGAGESGGDVAYISKFNMPTPTGLSSDAPYSDEDLFKYLDYFGIDRGAKRSKADVQRDVYRKADPFAKAAMWGQFGDTHKGGSGNKFSEFKMNPGEDYTSYKNRITQKYGNIKGLEEALAPLEENFADANYGARTLRLLKTLTPNEPIDPPREPRFPSFDIPPRTVAPELDRGFIDVPSAGEPPANFWLQDKIKTSGAFWDLNRINKYMPWQADYNPNLMTPTFYDPTRELAANAEAANISSQAIGMYAGPQAMNARLSQVQGNAAKNAADILGRYNTNNVGVANQFEAQNTEILNRYGADKVNRLTSLYDKNTIVNQNFDNAKNMARQNLRQSYIDAITNRAQTQALNSTQQQYYVDPTTGGFINFYKGKNLVASTPQSQGQKLGDLYKDLINNGFNPEDAMKLLTKS